MYENYESICVLSVKIIWGPTIRVSVMAHHTPVFLPWRGTSKVCLGFVLLQYIIGIPTQIEPGFISTTGIFWITCSCSGFLCYLKSKPVPAQLTVAGLSLPKVNILTWLQFHQGFPQRSILSSLFLVQGRSRYVYALYSPKKIAHEPGTLKQGYLGQDFLLCNLYDLLFIQV